ncbi:DUF2170 family protein [Vreelandella salicampi]|uniref:DUF2170 family protein n=1 Tax=Vreelandella salicampi TaxID=1449798 RepID=A0A7Z0RVV6_9GAMM|nr:DUF2170 family protein [Halomonas salicampi]
MSLHDKLHQVQQSVESGAIAWPTHIVELASENDSLVFTMPDHGELTVTVTCGEDEWLVMTEVAPVSAVKDVAAFNHTLLRLGMALPLVSIGIGQLGERESYVVYGQLFADCKFEALSAEIEACANAALEVADLIDSE